MENLQVRQKFWTAEQTVQMPLNRLSFGPQTLMSRYLPRAGSASLEQEKTSQIKRRGQWALSLYDIVSQWSLYSDSNMEGEVKRCTDYSGMHGIRSQQGFLAVDLRPSQTTSSSMGQWILMSCMSVFVCLCVHAHPVHAAQVLNDGVLGI